MHETSLVQSLFSEVAAVLGDRPIASVERIRVEIGPLSGVEPLLVRSAFERLVDSSVCRGAVLEIELVELTARCLDCRRELVIEDYCFRCPDCDSPRVSLTGGEEFRLLDVTLVEDEPQSSTDDEGLVFNAASGIREAT